MDLVKKYTGYPTIINNLSLQSSRVRKIVEIAAMNVNNAVGQAIQVIGRNRARISDVADHLDNEFVAELGFTQADEIREINDLENEFQRFYNKAIWEAEFQEFNSDLLDKANELELYERELREKEENIEEIIRARVAEAEARMREEGTTSRSLFNSALIKADRIVDQNKITRFAYSTISRFQEEFLNIQGTSDVEFITKLFQETIEPFQSTKIITDKDGNKVKVVTNTFSEPCYQDLFFFFYKYYNELTEIFLEKEALPSSAEELARIFQKKKKEAHEVVKSVHKKRTVNKR